MNYADLIAGYDFLLLVVYAIVVYFLLKAFVFKKLDKNQTRLFTLFFTLKVICAALMGYLLVYYWGVSDNFAYFTESKNLLKIIRTDFSNIQYLFRPAADYSEKINMDNELVITASSGHEGNFLTVKTAAILYPISFGRYLIVNFFFSIIAAIGQFKFFLAISNRYPHIKKQVAIAILLMPSVLIYSSYLNKETLCMAFMGFGFYNYFQVINKKNRILNLTFLLLNIIFILIIKQYIVIAFLAAFAFAYLVKLFFRFWKGSVFSKAAATICVALILWLFFSNLDYFDSYIADFADQSNFFQEQYNAQEQTSAFEFGELETSFAGLVKKAPLGIYTTYFRPQLWEVNKPIILFSALESFFVFVLTLWAVVMRFRSIGALFRNDLLARISFYYVLIFGVIVGLTTFNFGSLVRYKIPAVPFLMLFIFLLLNYKAPKKEVTNN
ncbi:MAG: hypothetical protein QM737_07635 [Ferruginibacter sp.]